MNVKRVFKIRVAAVLLFLCLPFIETPVKPARGEQNEASAPIVVKSYPDKESAGWAYKSSDIAFVVEQEGCRIQWNVVQYKDKPNKRDIEVRRQCAQPYAKQMALHQAIAKEIFSRWPVTEFDALVWPGFGQKTDWSWCVPIAVASSKSPEYADYRKHYPNSKMTNLNGLFVQLADATNAYNDLRDVFKIFGADVKLSSVEKVFAMKVKDLPSPLAAELKKKGVGSDMRVIYDVGMSYFNIIEQ